MSEMHSARQEQNQDAKEANAQIANSIINTFNDLSFRATFLGDIKLTEFNPSQLTQCHTLYREDTPKLFYKIILPIGAEQKLELFQLYLSGEVRLYSQNPRVTVIASPGSDGGDSWIVGKRDNAKMTDEEIEVYSESFFETFDLAIAGYEKTANLS